MTRRIPRWIARTPIPLYRYGFGPLLGRRLMMLEHRGRVSGQRRYVVLEVVDRLPEGLILVSGYGRESQWYRNVLTDPAVRVWTGTRRAAPARAVPIPTDEVPLRLTEYRQRHRRAARTLGRALDIPELAGDSPLPAKIGDRLPLVHIQFTETPSS